MTRICPLKRLIVVLGYLSVIGILVLSSMVLFSPYRMDRSMAFLDPWGKQDSAHPLVQAIARVVDPRR